MRVRSVETFSCVRPVLSYLKLYNKEMVTKQMDAQSTESE